MGLLGKQDMLNVDEIEKLCKSLSSKEVKVQKKDQVKFEFKEKGAKPVITKNVCQFSITGQDFNTEKIAEALKAMGVVELE